MCGMRADLLGRLTSCEVAQSRRKTPPATLTQRRPSSARKQVERPRELCRISTERLKQAAAIEQQFGKEAADVATTQIAKDFSTFGENNLASRSKFDQLLLTAHLRAPSS